MTEEKKVINDLVYFDNLKIVQNKDYFNFSLDSVLLPSFVRINKNVKFILDICTGNAPIPIILSQKTNSKIIAVEIQKEVYDLAKESIKINNIKNIDLLNMDAKKLIEKFETDTFDIITCNPPYFKVSEFSKKNDNVIKSIARHEILINLDEIMKISKKLLKNNGSIYLVHRTERLIEIVEKMKNNNIEPKRLQFIYPKIGEKSNIILIEGKKNGKPGLQVLPPLIVHNFDGSYTEEVLKIFGM